MGIEFEKEDLVSAIPAIALALACVALLIAAEAWWLIRRMAKRLMTAETMISMLCRFIVRSVEAIEEEKATGETRKTVN